MDKVLLVNPENCHACRTCEMVCSATHENTINPFQSRIKIIQWENEGEGFPAVCAQCEDAPCRAICPVKAIYVDESLSSVMIDYNLCIGCRMCIAVCPFGMMHFDSVTRKIIKCDLCEGEPICVKFCPYEALEYVDTAELETGKRREGAKQLLKFLRKTVSTQNNI